MKNRDERRAYRSLCGGGVTAASILRKFQSPNNVTERSGSGVVDEGVGSRRASAPAWSRSAAAFLLCSSVRR
jgi:hypothetical protein